jgi:hypothetical protein
MRAPGRCLKPEPVDSESFGPVSRLPAAHPPAALVQLVRQEDRVRDAILFRVRKLGGLLLSSPQ